MKHAIGTMVVFYLVTFWFGWFFFDVIFPGSGVQASYFKPVYAGLTLLVGIVVGCARVIYDEIKELKQMIREQNKAAEQTETDN